jgi:putative transposase
MWIMAGNGKRYSREFRERAVGLVFEHVSEYASEWEAIYAVASKLGVSGETLRGVGAAGRDRCGRADGALERGDGRVEVTAEGECRVASSERDPESRVGLLREGARPSTTALVAFITDCKDRFGVEPICTVLTDYGIKIAPSTYYAARSRPKSRRAVEDEKLMEEIQRVYEENYRVYGARKIWHQLQRDGIKIGRGRVERLMRRLGLAGAVRGKTVRTAIQDRARCGPGQNGSSPLARRTGCG